MYAESDFNKNNVFGRTWMNFCGFQYKNNFK